MRYPKECVLKECQEVVIRPLEGKDEPLLRRFFDETPKEDRWYMRYDVADTGAFDLDHPRSGICQAGAAIGRCHRLF